MEPQDGSLPISWLRTHGMSSPLIKVDPQIAMVDRQAIQELVTQLAKLLDEENFDEWLKLFDAGGIYELSAYSPEIRKWMTWWKSDRAELSARLKQLKEHVRDPATRRHVVGGTVVELDGDRARAVSSFAVYRTEQDGQSKLYMVGRYEDVLIRKAGAWFYTLHKAIADTRTMEIGTHIPI